MPRADACARDCSNSGVFSRACAASASSDHVAPRLFQMVRRGRPDMSERRRAPRYVLNTPLQGVAMPMQDAVVEQFSGDHLVVIAPSARPPEEELMVHLATPAGLSTHAAHVRSSTPITMGGTVSFRLELQVEPAAAPRDEERA
jgi:hypothetical protein